MAELGLGMVANIDLDLIPVTLVVADLLAVHADWDDAAQGLDLLHRPPQLLVGLS